MFVSRIFRWLPSWRCLGIWVTLLAYLSATVGLPSGDWETPATGCQCSEELKAAGQCCCAKKLAGLNESPQASCGSSKKPKPARIEVKSCCQASSKPQAETSCCSAKEKSCPAEVPRLTACGCEGKTLGGFLCNADPRLPAQTASVQCPLGWSERIQDPGVALPLCRLAPETPPPKALAA